MCFQAQSGTWAVRNKRVGDLCLLTCGGRQLNGCQHSPLSAQNLLNQQFSCHQSGSESKHTLGFDFIDSPHWKCRIRSQQAEIIPRDPGACGGFSVSLISHFSKHGLLAQVKPCWVIFHVGDVNKLVLGGLGCNKPWHTSQSLGVGRGYPSRDKGMLRVS